MMDAVRDGLSGAQVLVTGARGFLGIHLCPKPVDPVCKVTAVSRTTVAAQDPGIDWRQCNVEDFAEAEELVRHRRPDVIFHLGGRVSAAPDLSLVLATFHSLLTTTVNLLTLACRYRCRRIVLLGSLEEPFEAAVAEATPASPYSAAKWAASGYGRMFHRLYDCSTVSVRPFMTYGPAQAPVKIIPSTIISLLQREAPQLSSGRRALDWIYVDDVINGLLYAATAGNAEGQTIDLGSGRVVPIRTIVESLVRLIDPSITPRFGALPDRPGGDVRVADLDRMIGRAS